MKKSRTSPAATLVSPRVPARLRVVMAGKLLPLHRLVSVSSRRNSRVRR